ncbi:MAG: carboxypeptidase-like regulatory domain-containing protein [Myxococcales bacterium]|nr:carboxypeptidase-like regulatory domain-containing protein [Myxococcales bacterium]
MRIQSLFAIAIAAAVTSSCSTAVDLSPTSSSQDYETGKAGMIRGIVSNEHGWELGEIVVLAVSDEGTGSRIGYSDTHGIYSIHDLAPGDYTLRVRRGTAFVLEQRVKVAEGTSRDVHLRLPAVYGDRPDQRNRPIVDRSLIRSTAQPGQSSSIPSPL